MLDAAVIGSGPNGLAAAIALARTGLDVAIFEQHETPGGGMRTGPLTLPGFQHDVCSSVHPLGIASPFFRTLDLGRYGLAWIDSPAPLAHVMDRAVVLERSVEETARGLGRDGEAYRTLVEPFVRRFDELLRMLLGPLRFPTSPFLLAAFGLAGLSSARGLIERRFETPEARALMAGVAAHAVLPLEQRATASFALVLAIAAHGAGWPIARGGSGAIVDALVRLFESLGGTIETGRPVRSMRDLPAARAYLFDVSPRQLLEIAADDLPPSYRHRLARYRYGPGVCKVDWALAGPIPWRDPECARAATVHLAGTLDDVARSESAVFRGAIDARPFVILVQPTLFDPERAPAGRHIAWGYCHVPNGSDVDATAAIEAQIERAAPGFRDIVLAKSVRTARDLESYNPNYVGGDIGGGRNDLAQVFFRPAARLDPYSTPNPRIFLCSASTPPGGGVHGMCGYWGAESALRRAFARTQPAALSRPDISASPAG